MGDNQKTEMLKEVFSQYWQHARHQETQRLSFMQHCAVITGGIFTIAFSVSGLQKEAKILLLLLAVALAISGILITLAWRVSFLQYTSRAHDILKRQMFNDFLPYARIKKKKIMPAHEVFLLFYNLILAMCVASIILIRSTCTNYCLLLWISILVFVFTGGATLVGNYYCEKPYKEENQEEKKKEEENKKQKKVEE